MYSFTPQERESDLYKEFIAEFPKGDWHDWQN